MPKNGRVREVETQGSPNGPQGGTHERLQEVRHDGFH
jgi:hypothetical protein